ncbi:MAG: four helix bundle protein [Candidatus Kerfeldbacteria bacterium CG_4_10_14_0_8_um_filter_42_10]|uniref:Four helix bundle protein n=1 Tax=Candidatus Kerfeldbacteria bacterium CG_4_10_14_0_8_um_filter_42_10 TaxID=2014248 RepID=A0A2M7RKR8_9BACT|nr:MAG: four helix bundle protein [Candidatus Kerfeldbacteria bacterium CG_4_10_14_0_8_um_filter_42_10]
MNKKFLQLKDIGAYTAAFYLSNYVWDLVIKWDYFSKDTMGKQFARSIDSISANIAEGFGRYGKKDKICFYRYSYGSVKESEDWLNKSKERNLLTKEQFNFINSELLKLPKSINYLISFTNQKLLH